MRYTLPLLLCLFLVACDSSDGGTPVVTGTYAGSTAGGSTSVSMALTEDEFGNVAGTLTYGTDNISVTGRHEHPALTLAYASDPSRLFVGTVSGNGQRITGELPGGSAVTLTRQ